MKTKNSLRTDALQYHAKGRPGKIEVKPTKSYSTQKDLSLAYSPGVAEPCRDIAEDENKIYDYTTKSNLVGVISNGSAVLGLGNIGAKAGKPVMEGKGFLFKVYSDIDVFDVEVNSQNVDEFVRTVVDISPTFGGINLEDIKAPECFEIEKKIKEQTDIPIMHDDQHGTAIITAAALLNALEINGKKLEELKVVVNGAGASGISCINLYLSLGVKKENIIMLDSKGVIRTDRKQLPKHKSYFATDKDLHTLEEAIKGADLFLGLSVGNIMSSEMLKSMADDPIVFALANPDPEIRYDDAIQIRDDVIMATGRSDFPNQVNNVLGFPYIFRGALDVRATEINEEMKLAASRALANLAKEPVPEEVNQMYQTGNLYFSKNYLIPKPSDPRLIYYVSTAVAKAAMESGVARQPISDWKQYTDRLLHKIGMFNPLINRIRTRAQRNPKRVVFGDAESYKMLKAAEVAIQEGIADPVLLGNKQFITNMITEYELKIPNNTEIIDPNSQEESGRIEEYAEILFQKRKRKGITKKTALDKITSKNYFSPMLVETGYADAMVSGLTNNYPDAIRPALQTIGRREAHNIVSGMYIIHTSKGPFFFSDCTVNTAPDASKLVDITLETAEMVKKFNIEPRIALVSYSNFGSNRGPEPNMVKAAVQKLHANYPELLVDGELQANVALNGEILSNIFPFSKLEDAPANTLIFPNLTAGNIAYKVLQELTDHEIIGPILLGMKKPVHIIPMGSTVNEILNMVSIAVNEAQ